MPNRKKYMSGTSDSVPDQLTAKTKAHLSRIKDGDYQTPDLRRPAKDQRPPARPSGLRSPKTSPRAPERPADLMAGEAVKRGNRSAERIAAEGTPQFADGGMVRGCKPGQMSGKGFSGTY